MSLLNEWIKAKKIFLPSALTSKQVKQNRRCFYAGVQATLTHVFAIGNEERSEEETERIIEGFFAELEEFHQNIGEGKDQN